jgi:hypothetical protein
MKTAKQSVFWFPKWKPPDTIQMGINGEALEEATMHEALKVTKSGLGIKQLREHAGFTLPQFAEKLGWNKGQLSKYENNILALPLSAIEEIANALGHSVSVVVLYLLKIQYPDLNGSETGERFDRLVEQLEKEL